MKELLLDLLLAVITAAVPVLTTYAVGYINKAKERAIANTEDTRAISKRSQTQFQTQYRPPVRPMWTH